MSEQRIDSLDIQIETSLGSDTAQQIGKASNAIKRMAENLKNVDTSKLEKLNSIFKGTKELESYAKGMKAVSSSVKTLSKIDQTGLSNAKNVLKEISSMKFDFSQFKDLQNIDFSGLSKFGKSLQSAKANAKQAADALKPIEERMTIGADQQKPDDLKLTSPKIMASKSTLAALKQAKAEMGWSATTTRPIESFRANFGADAKPRVETSYANQYDDATERAMAYMQKYAEANGNAKKSAEELLVAMKSLSAPEINTTDIKKLQRELDSTSQKLNNLVTKQMNDIAMGASPTSKPMMNLERQIEETRLKMDALKDKMAKVQSTPISLKTVGLEKLKTLLGGLKATLASLGGKALKGIGNGLKSIGSNVLQFGRNLVTGKASAEKFHNSLGGGLKTFLKYGLGIRSTFVLLNKLRSAFGNAMNNLTQYSSTTNKAVSSMWNSLNALKNSTATAFAPIINSVAPYISALIDMLTDGMNAIAQFFAALTGAKTVVLAKKQNKSYAASIGNIGSSASDSSDKVKDLADSLDLLDFDEINKLSDNTSNNGSGGSGGSSGGSGSSVSGMFETETVDSAFSEMADLFKNGKWNEIGDIIADGINGALSKIDTAINWDNVGDKITTICTGITTIFNRVVEKMDWSMLGKTVGDGVNTVVNTLNLLCDGVDWGNLGSKLATSVNSIFTTVDWDAVGKLIVQKFNAIWETAEGFFKTIDGTAIGKSIATTMQSAMKNLNLKSAGNALSNALNTLSDIIGGFNDTINWSDMTSKLTENIKSFFENVNWAELSANVGELLGNLVKSIVSIVTDPDTLGAITIAGTNLILGFFDGILTAIGGDAWTKVKEAVKGVNDWLNEDGFKSTGYTVLNSVKFDFEIDSESKKNLATAIGKLNSEVPELKIDAKLMQSGDEAWKEYAKQFNDSNPKLSIPDDVVNGGKETIIKWLADAYEQDPDFMMPVSTSQTGAEAAATSLGDWNQYYKTNTATISTKTDKTGKDTAAESLGGWSAYIKSNPAVLKTKTDKTGKETAEDFAKEVNASGAKATINVEGKLNNKLDTSKLGNVTVNATAKATKIDENGKSLYAPFRATELNKNGKSLSAPFLATKVDASGKNIQIYGEVKAKSDIKKKTNGKSINAVADSVTVKNVKGSSGPIKKLLNMIGIKKDGGVFSGGSWSSLPQFANGGFVSSQRIGRFAGGGLPQHGSLFVAGEAGSEIVGNIGGRTEVLNQSQIASAIYAAMLQAMKQQNVNVNVALQGDANTMFKVVQNKARQYTVQTGKMPFA